MRFAPTLPPAMYPELDVGKYHLVQAHHLAQADGDVIDWFKEREHETGHVTILDNGVIEEGQPCIDELQEMIRAVNPSAVICPDSFRKYGETLDLFYEWAPKLSQMVPTLMLVPHGLSLITWCECASEMITHATEQGIRFIIGVPKVLSTLEGGRWQALAYLEWLHPEVRTHLLGAWYGMSEVLECVQWFPSILGFDSTLPYAQALEHYHTIEVYNEKYTLQSDDWDATPYDISEEILWMARMNIATVEKLLERSAANAPCSTDLPQWVTGPRLERQRP